MRPTEAVDAHRDLMDCLAVPEVKTFSRNIVASVNMAVNDPLARDSADRALSDKNALQAGDEAITILEGALKIGETCWASDKMVEFARIAASEFTSEDQFTTKHLLIENGVMFFEHTVIDTDIRGDKFFIDGVAWRTFAGRYTMLYWFVNNYKHPANNSVSVPNDYHKSAIARSPYHLVHFTTVMEGEVIGNRFIDNDELQRIAEVKGHDPFPADIELENVNAVWWALMQLMGQTLVSVSQARPARAGVKRAMRANLKPIITVIALRKKKYVGPRIEKEGSRKYTNWRWLVRGHWRWINDKDNPGEKKRIYISHYWKGPEDAPLLVSHKVNALSR